MTFILRTARLCLVPAALDFGRALTQAGWLNDPAVVRYSEQRHRKHTMSTQMDYIRSFEPPNRLMEIRIGEKMIGTLTIYVDEPNSVADMGILIGEKSYWNKGLGLEAWKAAMDYAFNNGVRKVEAGCISANLGMMHICRQSGMEEEGRRPRHFLCGNELYAMVMFGKER